jgi:hypothetical protein
MTKTRFKIAESVLLIVSLGLFIQPLESTDVPLYGSDVFPIATSCLAFFLSRLIRHFENRFSALLAIVETTAFLLIWTLSLMSNALR